MRAIQTPEVLRGVSTSPDGKVVATAGGHFGPGSAKLWDLETGKELVDLPVVKAECMAVAFAPDGNTLATASSDRLVRIWERADGKLKATCTGHANYVRSVVFSPDGKILASSSDESLRLWDAETGKEKATAKGFVGPSAWRVPTFMAFSPDGKRIASGTGDKQIKIWNVDMGEEVATLEGHANIVWAVIYSPDGKQLASAGFDGTNRLWDSDARKELASFKAHDGWVHCIAFSPDGNTLVSCGGDKKVKLWDVATRQERLAQVLPEHATSVSLTADGKSYRTKPLASS